MTMNNRLKNSGHNWCYPTMLLFTLIFTFVFILGCEDTEPKLPTPVTWQSNLPGYDARLMIQCANEDYVVWNVPYVVRLDKYGNLLWKKEIDNWFIAKSITESDQGDILVAGAYQALDPYGNPTFTYAAIIKIDFKNVKRWVIYPFGDYTPFSSCDFIKQTGNNSFLVAGVAYQPDSSIHIININGDGIAEPVITFPFPSEEESQVSDIIITASNELVLTMSLTGPTEHGFEAYKTDLHGHVIWQIVPEKIQSPLAGNILEKEDLSGYVLCGSEDTTGWVMKVSNAGAALWETVWGLHRGVSVVRGIASSPEEEGYTVVGDFIGDGNPGFWLFQMNNEGIIGLGEEPVYYYGGGWAVASGIMLTKDNYIAFCGQSSKGVVYKVDPDLSMY